MIYAYPPIRALDSYQTHKDYYRVSAVSRAAGGKSNTIRRPLDMPFEGLAYKQITQSAAKDVTGFVGITQLADGNLELKPYGQYRSRLQAYLPVPMSGLLLDIQI